ncbi:MAG: aminotransferase class IV [Flavobacteriaceae bacterium]|nr:aminotransferase class IV [Flavobacteriaceae bacterium]
MENFNGNISLNAGNLTSNRAFKYGDALFDTLKYANNQLEFLEDHYFRLMASMRLLRMEIPMNFTLEFYEATILKSIDFSLNSNQYRIRVTVFRANGGLYLPDSNKINYLIETSPLNLIRHTKYEVDIFKDFYISATFLSTIKTSNRILNVLASIYADENQLQNCLLLNENKQIIEFINGNIFVINENQVVTPPLSEGCINGIYRRKLMEVIQNKSTYELIEKPLIYTDLLNASEVFLTNSIIGIQPITHFKKKIYKTEIASNFKKLMENQLI